MQIQKAVDSGWLQLSRNLDYTGALSKAAYQKFHIFSIKTLLRAKYAKQDLSDVLKMILSNRTKYGFENCKFKELPIDFDQPEDDILKCFEKRFISQDPFIPADKCISKVRPRPAKNSKLVCYANALFQCLATFYPFFVHLVSQIPSGTMLPPVFKSFMTIIEELNKDSTEAYNATSAMELRSVWSSMSLFENIFSSAPFIPSFSEIVYHDYLFFVTSNNFCPEYHSNFYSDEIPLDDQFFTQGKHSYFNVKGPIFICNYESSLDTEPLIVDHHLKNHISGNLEHFSLFAVTIWKPLGSINHYAALVKRGDKWFLCNDSSITELQTENLPTSTEKFEKFGWEFHVGFYLRV